MNFIKRWKKSRKAIDESDFPQANGKVALYIALYRFLGGKRHERP